MSTKPRSRTRLATTAASAAKRNSPVSSGGSDLTSKTMATLRKVGSAKVYVPLLLAAGVGAAIFARVMWPTRSGPRARIAHAFAELQPQVSATVRRLADFGREMRERVR